MPETTGPLGEEELAKIKNEPAPGLTQEAEALRQEAEAKQVADVLESEEPQLGPAPPPASEGAHVTADPGLDPSGQPLPGGGSPPGEGSLSRAETSPPSSDDDPFKPITAQEILGDELYERMAGEAFRGMTPQEALSLGAVFATNPDLGLAFYNSRQNKQMAAQQTLLDLNSQVGQYNKGLQMEKGRQERHEQTVRRYEMQEMAQLIPRVNEQLGLEGNPHEAAGEPMPRIGVDNLEEMSTWLAKWGPVGEQAAAKKTAIDQVFEETEKKIFDGSLYADPVAEFDMMLDLRVPGLSEAEKMQLGPYRNRLNDAARWAETKRRQARVEFDMQMLEVRETMRLAEEELKNAQEALDIKRDGQALQRLGQHERMMFNLDKSMAQLEAMKTNLVLMGGEPENIQKIQADQQGLLSQKLDLMARYNDLAGKVGMELQSSVSEANAALAEAMVLAETAQLEDLNMRNAMQRQTIWNDVRDDLGRPPVEGETGQLSPELFRMFIRNNANEGSPIVRVYKENVINLLIKRLNNDPEKILEMQRALTRSSLSGLFTGEENLFGVPPNAGAPAPKVVPGAPPASKESSGN